MAVEPPNREGTEVGSEFNLQDNMTTIQESVAVTVTEPLSDSRRSDAKVHIIRNDEDDSEWSNQDDSYD